jgi:ATPase
MPYTFLPDSSVMLNRKIINFIENDFLINYTPNQNIDVTKTDDLLIVLSRVVLAEIENQANQTKSHENLGLEVLHELYRLDLERVIKLKVVGERPTLEQIRLNSGGELDALIRKDALSEKAILITADEVQSSVALVEGIDVLFTMNIPSEMNEQNEANSEDSTKFATEIHEYFDDTTMSVHLRGHCVPLAKKGKPGDWNLLPINDVVMEPQTVAEIGARILTQAKFDDKSFIERNEPGVSVVQLRTYRIVICRPPFSNTHEITAVHPLVSLTLKDYDLSRDMYDRLDIAEGVLVAGSPGAGKSTFISALTLYYLEKNKLVKTLESVRDLNVPPEVSQYAPLDGSMEKTADILLLIRPDFTIFDEVRTESDFKIFGDLRLAGVGLVGVVHASNAIDAVQRFIRRIELGVIPNVIDTIIFIDEGKVGEVLTLEMTVKKPTGFADRDLSRPVIEVREFIHNELYYEIYAFGSDIIVAPVGRAKYRNKKKNQNRQNKSNGKNNNRNKGRINEFNGDNNNDDDNDFDADYDGMIPVNVYQKNKSVMLSVSRQFGNQFMSFYADDKFIFSRTLNQNGQVSLKKKDFNYAKVMKKMRTGTQFFAAKK